jgi:hypothetical protein
MRSGAVKQSAGVCIRLWQRRALYSTGALVLSCALVYPFLEGHSPHSYWESFGKYLLFLPMALLLVSLYCNGLWWAAWQARPAINSRTAPLTSRKHFCGKCCPCCSQPTGNAA